MSRIAMLSFLLLMVGCAFSYPAVNQDQDYLEYLAEMAASKGRDLFAGGRPDGPDAFDMFYGGDSNDYSPQYKALAMQALEEQMDRAGYGATLEEEESTIWNGRLTDVPEWSAPVSAGIGQVGGVAVCPEGNPHVFHRADRVFDAGTFDAENNLVDQTPIANNTVLTLNPETGNVEEAWGAGKFYLPHGLTIDNHGNLWFTDIGLHQVLKYSPKHELLMTLGEALKPGHDKEHFCKPTSVAVASNGDFFVADGYCNSRVVKFDASGKYVGEFGQDEFMNIPHGITLLEKYDAVCVADRENRRIVCYDAGLGNPSALGEVLRIYNTGAVGRPYSIVYSVQDDLLYGVGVDDGEDEDDEVTNLGFTIDPSEEQSYYTDIVSTWAPKQGFESPHAMAVSPDGEEVYVGELFTKDPAHSVWKFIKAEQPKNEEMMKEPQEPEQEEEEEEDEEEDDEEEEDEEEEEEEEEKKKEEDAKEE